MFKRRDIPPVLLLLLLIILVMLTLSQILVVHNGRYGKNVHTMRKLQLELRQMDLNLHALMMQNVPSIELSKRLLQNEINGNKVARIMAEASRPNQSAVPPRARTGGGAGRFGQGYHQHHQHQHHLKSHHHTRELHSQHYYPAHDILDLDSGAQGLLRGDNNVIRTMEQKQPIPLTPPLAESEWSEQTFPNGSRTAANATMGRPVGRTSSMNLNHSCCNETFIKRYPQGQAAPTAVYKPTVITPSDRSKLKYCPSIPPDLSEYEFMVYRSSPRLIIDTLLHMRDAVR